jgi:hypothetical protein
LLADRQSLTEEDPTWRQQEELLGAMATAPTPMAEAALALPP